MKVVKDNSQYIRYKFEDYLIEQIKRGRVRLKATRKWNIQGKCIWGRAFCRPRYEYSTHTEVLWTAPDILLRGKFCRALAFLLKMNSHLDFDKKYRTLCRQINNSEVLRDLRGIKSVLDEEKNTIKKANLAGAAMKIKKGNFVASDTSRSYLQWFLNEKLDLEQVNDWSGIWSRVKRMSNTMYEMIDVKFRKRFIGTLMLEQLLETEDDDLFANLFIAAGFELDLDEDVDRDFVNKLIKGNIWRLTVISHKVNNWKKVQPNFSKIDDKEEINLLLNFFEPDEAGWKWIFQKFFPKTYSRLLD